MGLNWTLNFKYRIAKVKKDAFDEIIQNKPHDFKNNIQCYFAQFLCDFAQKLYF